VEAPELTDDDEKTLLEVDMRRSEDEVLPSP
jgi:hypothetical protein